jgi:uncharacterized protein YfaS (alpha-2-macroglobulin family)
MVSVDVMNTGGEQGTYTVDVKVDGTTVTTQNVTLADGASQTVKRVLPQAKWVLIHYR